MKKILTLSACLFVFIALINVGCKKKDPQPVTPSVGKVYLVKFEVTFTGGTGTNKIEYTHNDGYSMVEFNQPNSWSYSLARKTGDTVSVAATSYDGTSASVRILLNDVPWKYSYVNTGNLPYVAAIDGVLP